MALVINRFDKRVNKPYEKSDDYYNLERCGICKLKVSKHKLVALNNKFLCKFCLTSIIKGANNV